MCVLLSLSRDILRVTASMARSALHSSNSVDIEIKELTFTSVKIQLFKTMNDCLKLLFSFRGRLLNENLDVWAVAVSSLLELLIRLYTESYQDSGVRDLVTESSCLVLEPFSKFLRLHPCRKNAFRDFVDKLLEPLLHLLGLLHDQTRDKSLILVQKLFKLVEEILSYGLFHSVHLDEYLSLHITYKYNSSVDKKLRSSRMIIKSFHRHLFNKVDNLVSEGRIWALPSLENVFRLFIVNVKKLKKESQVAESSRASETPHLSKVSNSTTEKNHTTKTPASEIRMSFFDFFGEVKPNNGAS